MISSAPSPGICSPATRLLSLRVSVLGRRCRFLRSPCQLAISSHHLAICLCRWAPDTRVSAPTVCVGSPSTCVTVTNRRWQILFGSGTCVGSARAFGLAAPTRFLTPCPYFWAVIPVRDPLRRSVLADVHEDDSREPSGCGELLGRQSAVLGRAARSGLESSPKTLTAHISSWKNIYICDVCAHNIRGTSHVDTSNFILCCFAYVAVKHPC